MSFVTYFPSEALKPFVQSYAISITEKAQSYKVLPGTAIVMGFQFAGKLSYTTGEQQLPLTAAGVTGLMDSYRVFHNTAHTHSLLVMFTETGASSFFNVPLHELFGQSLSLDQLLLRSQMDVVSERLQACTDDHTCIQVIEQFLFAHIRRNKTDELVSVAIGLIRQSQGTVRIKALAEQLCISQSRLEKRFRAAVGASPKKFASIVRIRHLMTLASQQPKLTLMGLEAGYFDQAHFIKDFKSFTGETPEEFFGKGGI